MSWTMTGSVLWILLIGICETENKSPGQFAALHFYSDAPAFLIFNLARLP